jgi:hypothetical protein
MALIGSLASFNRATHIYDQNLHDLLLPSGKDDFLRIRSEQTYDIFM